MYFYLLEIVGYIFICVLTMYFWYVFMDYSYAVQYSNVVATSHIWLLNFKSIEITWNKKFSSSTASAIFQVATILEVQV